MSSAPSKQERKQCHMARDLYFKCLDDNNDDIYKCTESLAKFEEKCPKTWIKHFEQTRERQLLDKLRRQGRVAPNS